MTEQGQLPMRFQKRDGDLLARIHECDGVMAKRQIKEMFWMDRSTRAMEKRLAKLRSQAYIDWPDASEWRSRPVPEPVCWLGWRGAVYVASRNGIDVEPPKRGNEYQLRELQKRLRASRFRWRREPRWDQLDHDLAIVDFRQSVERSVGLLDRYSLDEWIHEGEFRANTDVVEFYVEDRDGAERRRRKGICPDSYFAIVDEDSRSQGGQRKANFLLEVDMATHETSRFGVEKAAAGAAYVKSKPYRDRFGHNAGWWLVITTSKTRMRHLIRQTLAKAGTDSRMFYFSTFAILKGADPLNSPAWVECPSGLTVALLKIGITKTQKQPILIE